jgi:hypothetical protein
LREKDDLEALHTSRVGVDLPVAVEGTATEEQVEDDDQITHKHQTVPDIDTDLVESAHTSLLKDVRGYTAM